MVNVHNTVVVLQSSLLATNLSHALIGLYIWEYFTSLEYEWSVIRGHRPYRWTIWVYSLARFSALINVLLNVVIWDYTSPMNCQVVYSFGAFFAIVTLSACSLLIVLRVIAIWNRNKVVMAISISMWGINALVFVQFVARLRAAWAPAQQTCVGLNLEISVPNFITDLITDIGLLLIMLVGLFRLRRHGSGTLTQVLWKQNLIWLLLSIVAEVPPTVIIILDLRDLFYTMQVFVLLAWITMVIAATRMHRSLTDFVPGSADIAKGDLQNSGPPIQGAQRINDGSIPMNRTEVVMHTVSEQHGTLQTREDDSCISTDEQIHVIPNGLSCDHGRVGRAV